MASHIERRILATLVGGAAATWPLAARAQQPAMPVIGYLHSGSSAPFAHLVEAFRRALNESGYVEGRNVAIEYRWANGEYDRLPELANDLVKRQVGVIVTAGGGTSALAAKKATSTIPIVFSVGDDPVKFGLVTSLSHPGGNVTGVNVVIGALDSKKLGLLRELAPKATTIAVLENPKLPAVQDRLSSVLAAARSIGQQTQVFYVQRKGFGHDILACGAIRRGGACGGRGRILQQPPRSIGWAGGAICHSGDL